METTTVRRLSHDTASVLAQVAAGSTVEITKNGRPIARIVPLATDPLAALVARGVVLLPQTDEPGLSPASRVRLSGAGTAELLDDVRADRL